MKIKINEKVICFPPYISTTWDHVKSLRVEVDPPTQGELLVITLNDGYSIKIPNLDQKVIQAIFSAHLKYIEQKTEQPLNSSYTTALFGQSKEITGLPLRFNATNFEGLSSALQHNPEQADSPELPQEVLNKIAGIAKVMGVDDIAQLPKPEPHCNCMHCQIARSIQRGAQNNEEVIEEIVTDEDLKFRIWDITQNSEKLYTVTNPLDSNEQYSVFLGEPIGCTCGQKNCEHIRAVLNS